MAVSIIENNLIVERGRVLLLLAFSPVIVEKENGN
jgi:hypothetical protein